MQLPELLEIFRANLVARRKELGMTQIALSQASGIAQPHICYLESGRTKPTMETLAKLAQALRTTPDAMLSPKIFAAAG